VFERFLLGYTSLFQRGIFCRWPYSVRSLELENSVNLERIRAEYNVKHWSQGFYGIDDNGEVYVSPSETDHQVPLSKIVKQLEQRNIGLPALVRFP